MTDWTREWPTERGWYWLYGHTSRSAYAQVLEFMPVKVRLSGNNVWMYITGGSFIYKAEGARGLWTPMVTPTLPTDYQIEEVLG